MKLETVICELNPIHRGHRHVFDRARERGEVVAAVMSGNFVQRGEPALFDKYARAHAAVLAGVDLVVELPYPWCAAGAEAFALGGCTVAAGIGTSGLTFGSETGSLEDIERIAAVKESPDFAEIFAEEDARARDCGTAAVFERVLRRYGVETMPDANDKLGAEYLRWGRKAGIANFTAVERLREMKSASVLRAMDFAACAPYMPEESHEFLGTCGRCDYARYAELLFAHARLNLRGAEGDVLRVATKKARDVVDAGEFMRTCATKKYTAARVKRELLFSVTGVQPEWLKAAPGHTILLAANERGRRYLAENRKELAFPILTKPSTAAGDAGVRECAVFADEVYAYVNGKPAGWFMKQHPII